MDKLSIITSPSSNFFQIFLFLFLFSGSSASAYKNYTVGDSLGWYDNLEKPNVDYQKWVSGKIFSLGDFLIFNTDTNHSVVQTNNITTYKNCDYNDDLSNDTIQWSSADPSSTSPYSVSVAVQLSKLGITYFFSGDYDGEQCQNGQNFKLNVTYGKGLPAEAPSPVNPDFDNPDSAPDTLVPSNFDHPRNVTDDDDDGGGGNDETSMASSNLFWGVHLNGAILISLQLYGIF